MSASFNKFQSFMLEVGKGTHHMHAAGDVLKVFLSNEQPLAADDVKTDIAEISMTYEANFGAGGADIENDFTESGGQGQLSGVDKTFAASGGTVGPFQFVVCYNDTAASDELVGWWDYGSAITLQDGEEFTVDFGATILTIGA